LPLLFVPLGTLCHQLEIRAIAPDRIKRIYAEGRIGHFEPVELEGVLEGFPEPAQDGAFLTVRVEKIVLKDVRSPASGNVRLFVIGYDRATSDLDLRHGSIVRVACRLEREERFLNPGVASRTAMLDQQGIDAVATVKSRLLIEKLGDDSVFIPLAWAYEQRIRLIEAFRTNLSAKTAGVMTASLLGDKHFLDRETAEVFREGGTFHVLVISGLHITFIGGLTLWLVSMFTTRRVWQAIAATSFLWAYTFAVGAEIPVVRASIMFTLLLLSGLIYRQGSLLNALGTCTLLLLVWRPSDLFTPSFQLTFVSVAAIVGCAFPLIRKLRAIGSWTPSRETPLPADTWRPLIRYCELLYWNEAEWRIRSWREIWSAGLFKSPYLGWLRAPNLKFVAAYLFEGLLVSFIVQVCMLPLVVIYFHRVSPVGLVLNLWVGVLLAVESFAAMAAVIAAELSAWLAAPLIALTEVLNSLMMSLPWLLSSLQVSDFRVAVYTGPYMLVYVLYTAAVLAVARRLYGWDPFALSNRRRPWLTLSIPVFLTIVFGLIVIIHPFSSPTPDGRLRFDFLDVGQGDAALVTFPDGQTMLVDGGGRVDYRDEDGDDVEPDVPRIGEAVVSEFLWGKGYSSVDYILATHSDTDHVQGLVDVADNFEVGSLIIGEDIDESRVVDILDAAERNRIPLSTVRRGDRFNVAGVEIRVLNPESPTEATTLKSSNDRSIVLRLQFGSRVFLLTGDIERVTEGELTDIRSDVVKVPHHGSRTSSTSGFVERASPQIAVISVGRRSRFGHPHPEVVRRWQLLDAEVITTGSRGTITIQTDGESIDVSTFQP
jgi:competence protein ComEC